MEKLVDLKLTRFIGISNFSPKQVDEILAVATIKPKVNQIEIHPYLQQQEFITSLQSIGIEVVAYAPLANTNQAYSFLGGNQVPRLLTNPKLNDIAKAKGCTSAQAALAWNMARKVAVIPKSSQEAEDMEKMKALQVPRRLMNIPCRPLGNACFQGLEGA